MTARFLKNMCTFMLCDLNSPSVGGFLRARMRIEREHDKTKYDIVI